MKKLLAYLITFILVLLYIYLTSLVVSFFDGGIIMWIITLFGGFGILGIILNLKEFIRNFNKQSTEKSVFGNSSKQNNMWGIPSKEQEQKNKDGKKAFSLDFDNKTEEAELLTEQELHNLAEMAGLAKSTPAQDLSDILSGTYASKRTHQVAAAEEAETFEENVKAIKKQLDILNFFARREFDNDFRELSDEDRAKVLSLIT